MERQLHVAILRGYPGGIRAQGRGVGAMNPRMFLRMARWARKPPSARRVVLGLMVIAACLALAALEWAGLLPDWFGIP